jgi:hypothetical protein
VKQNDWCVRCDHPWHGAAECGRECRVQSRYEIEWIGEGQGLVAMAKDGLGKIMRGPCVCRGAM